VKYLFLSAGQPIGKAEDIVLNDKLWIQAHRYVLCHCDNIEKFRRWVFYSHVIYINFINFIHILYTLTS
jgi:hypothetical protein